jgi:uncharacterized protein YutE (UPF0331/DUF86 family)
MEQVRMLNDDKATHFSAPMVLSGAAAEIALREMMDTRNLTAAKPGMSAMGQTLKSKGVLNKQDMKDLELIAGLRNSAAHGDFENLSDERAGLMEQQVNLFLARLHEIESP